MDDARIYPEEYGIVGGAGFHREAHKRSHLPLWQQVSFAADTNS
jgi:hypothetical protein